MSSLIFTELKLRGVFLIEPEPSADERGFFARVVDRGEFEKRGLKWRFPECSISFTPQKGTLRGMHYQLPPYEEAKLIRCTRGAIYDVVVDMRADSPTYCQWAAVELNPDNRSLLYIPEGLAHGFQTLSDNTEVSYQISAPHVPRAARGVRWDDPSFAIEWPQAADRIMSERDRGWPLVTEAR